MKTRWPEITPVDGKTYSLFGNSDSTSNYYKTIGNLADEILGIDPHISTWIERLKLFSAKKRSLKKLLKTPDPESHISRVINLIDHQLQEFTLRTEEHLRSLPISKIWDRRLATSREQYHLYMLEIELTNRFFAADFRNADKKVALMPYCLKDFSVICKSEKNGFDYQCKHCSSECFQNHASNILKDHQIEPYIWMEGDMKQLAKYTLKEKKSFGVLGIACIPELTWGMRNCRKNNIPVIGIPLNANRCVRWFGEFFPNSINLAELEKLVSG
jgi:hypothetical protein